MTKTAAATDDTDDLAAMRERLVTAALPHVPFEGWTRRALARAAVDCGLPAADVDRLFPGDGADMVDWHNIIADRLMVADLAALNPEAMKVRERIATAVRLRLRRAAPHREAVRRGLALMSLPTNTARGARMLHRTSDAVWRAAGDTASDWNHYSKRLLLSGVYMSTLLFWLQDESEDFRDTDAFLDRRIADALKLPGRAKGLLRPAELLGKRIRGLAGGGTPFRRKRRGRAFAGG